MNQFTEIQLRAASFGEENALPDIKNVSYIHAGFEVKPAVSEEERRYIGKGMIDTMIPYKMQDDYDRDKKLKRFKAVVLENEYLKAVFLPELGARLWSLFDKKSGKDLLYTNSVFQPCNLGLRNAWFSGGVEFNVGIKGHNPLTCAPLFTELLGDTGVRFYEYERIRGLSYSITAWLPEGSETLYIRTRVENASDKETQMYWWSNIAFPETENTRVIVPASDAIHCLYQEDHYVVNKQSIPINEEGVDVSRPMNLIASNDYFYKIPPQERKWIAAVDTNGTGLLQYSESFMKGRKLFLWGKKAGGRHWNEFLSEKGQAYIEIQAGLAHTQLEHIPMPANAVWEWTEAYTSLDGTQSSFYGDWATAIKTVENTLADKEKAAVSVAPEKLCELTPPTESRLVFYGSGWGALENATRIKRNKPLIDSVCAFPYRDTAETRDFHFLLENGYLPEKSVDETPNGYVAGEFWRDAMLQSLQNESGRHWFTYLQLGVTQYALGKLAEAQEAWEKSLEKTPSLWAYRNLGMLYLNEYKQTEQGLAYMRKAYQTKIARDTYAFLKEYAAVLTANGCDSEWLEVYQSLSASWQAKSRLQVFTAIALLNTDKPYEAAKIITPQFVLSDVKEGELSVSYLWKQIYTAIVRKETGATQAEAEKIAGEKYPLPYELDFRMHD